MAKKQKVLKHVKGPFWSSSAANDEADELRKQGENPVVTGQRPWYVEYVPRTD